jgi:SWI/SNF-related matrix-associated actin-dependent regulator of chromatin subfamily A containing DEAD/H box 1
LKGYEAVDQVFKHCEAHGEALSNIMRVWNEAAAASASSSQLDSPDDAGVHLVNLADKELEQKTQALDNPAVRAAFEDYIRQQPHSIPEGVVLKDYQMLGLNWLNLLYRRKTSCILADEMGVY